MIRRPPRSTLDRSSAASDVYKRQIHHVFNLPRVPAGAYQLLVKTDANEEVREGSLNAVSYTHLRAHETVLDLVCRLLLEKKKNKDQYQTLTVILYNKTHTHHEHTKLE